jgi:CheY-like chemotaxis protein/signal transduction histidine kinase
MWSKFNNHLAIKIALFTVITATLLGFLIGSFQIWSNLQDRKQHFQNSLDIVISTTLPSLALATYNFNVHLNQQLVDSLAAHPSIISASIITTQGKELSTTATYKTCTPSDLDVFLYGSNNQYEYPLSHQETLLGKLIIEVNYCKQNDYFIAEVKNTIVSNLILSLSIALFIYIIFYHFINQPINRLKSAGQIINNYSTNLEELVVERTKALTAINRQLTDANQELELSQKTSERFNQSQFKLLSNITYEFRFPLTNTIQTLTSFKNGNITAEDHLLLQGSINQNTTILSLLSELDGMAKLRSNLNNITISPFSFKRILSNIEATFKQNNCPCTFFIRYDSTLSNSHIGDIQKIEPLLFNLLANLYYCSPEQRINIDITEINHSILMKLSAPNLMINEHLFEKIILPFSNTLSSLRLTGLGLAFSEDLAETLGGKIHRSSNSQNEYELSLQLPLLSSDEQLHRICQQLPAGGIRISTSQQLTTNQITDALNEWQLPFNNSKQSSDAPVILITDNETDCQDATSIIGLGKRYDQIEKLKGIKVFSIKIMKEGLLFNALIQACSQLEDNKTSTQFARILLVEDNAINRKLSQRFLKNLNTDLEMVEDGREASNICTQKKFDLIFMDCRMPIMDGFQATRQIRRTPLNQTTPIIALTGLDSDDERQACLQAGMNDFITKPFTQEQLHNAIIQWLPS